MLIIVGLGNPGDTYRNTYHNMGYMAVDAIAKKLGTRLRRLDCSSYTVSLSRNGEKVVLAKPVTYMNLSGQAVKSLLTKHKACENNLIVIYDDIDLPRFQVRARYNGGPGTHNGMRDIVAKTGTENFKRIRIGIGKEQGELKDYVLKNIGKEDQALFDSVFEKVADAIESYITDGDFDALMRTLNS